MFSTWHQLPLMNQQSRVTFQIAKLALELTLSEANRLPNLSIPIKHHQDNVFVGHMLVIFACTSRPQHLLERCQSSEPIVEWAHPDTNLLPPLDISSTFHYLPYHGISPEKPKCTSKHLQMQIPCNAFKLHAFDGRFPCPASAAACPRALRHHEVPPDPLNPRCCFRNIKCEPNPPDNGSNHPWTFDLATSWQAKFIGHHSKTVEKSQYHWHNPSISKWDEHATAAGL